MIVWKDSIRSKFLAKVSKECVARGGSIRESSTLFQTIENFEAVSRNVKSCHNSEKKTAKIACS